MAAATKTAIFGQTFQCECGKTHRIQPDRIVIGQGYLQRLVELCSTAATGRRAAVLMDVRTRRLGGGAAGAAMSKAGWEVAELVVEDPPGRWPVCDDLTKDALASRLAELDLIVTVGSGVVTDLGKWLAFERNVPFLAVATAASMNGYASANVAPTIQGVKTLVRARPPVAVLAHTDVLCQAPYEMTAAGLGDLLAKSVSSTDWYLNHRLFGDDYCARSVGLIGEIEPIYLANPEYVRQRKPQIIEGLFLALLLTGAAMTMAETSAPASGGEHLVSHSLDMMASLDGSGHDLHGRQVGVGTVLAAELYQRVLAVESPRFIEPVAAVDGTFWGRLAPAVAERYAQKRQRLEAVAEKLSRGNAWDELRRELSGMVRRPETIQDCLRRAEAACRAADIGISRARLIRAFQHAHEVRSRFTVLDLARLMGIMPAAAGQIIEQWA